MSCLAHELFANFPQAIKQFTYFLLLSKARTSSVQNSCIILSARSVNDSLLPEGITSLYQVTNYILFHHFSH